MGALVIDISITFASRGRTQGLTKALNSLFDTAAKPKCIEAIVAIDYDDDAPSLASLPVGTRLWTSPERHGYTGLHHYLNALAKQATGDWLMWFNDDMIMKTYGWDDAVRLHRPAVLWPYANHVHHANIAPIWPKAWAEAVGHASPTTHMDTYLQRIGEALGRHDHIPVTILHDRADVTGGNADQTYAQGRELLGPEGMAPGWNEMWFQNQVATDAAVIRGLL